MPKATRQGIIQDSNITLPQQGGSNDIEFPLFALPGLAGHGTLFFRLRGFGRTTFQFFLNNSGTQAFQVDTSPSRSYHEVFPLSTLKAENNQLVMAITPVSGEPLGSVTLSDVVIFYEATI